MFALQRCALTHSLNIKIRRWSLLVEIETLFHLIFFVTADKNTPALVNFLLCYLFLFTQAALTALFRRRLCQTLQRKLCSNYFN